MKHISRLVAKKTNMCAIRFVLSLVAFTPSSAALGMQASNSDSEMDRLSAKAVQFCENPSQYGLEVKANGSITGTLESSKIERFFASISGTGTVGGEITRHHGVAQDQLAKALSDVDGCRLRAFSTFEEFYFRERRRNVGQEANPRPRQENHNTTAGTQRAIAAHKKTAYPQQPQNPQADEATTLARELGRQQAWKVNNYQDAIVHYAIDYGDRGIVIHETVEAINPSMWKVPMKDTASDPVMALKNWLCVPQRSSYKMIKAGAPIIIDYKDDFSDMVKGERLVSCDS